MRSAVISSGATRSSGRAGSFAAPVMLQGHSPRGARATEGSLRMNRQRTWLVLMAWVLAAFVGCGACDEPTRESPAAAPGKQEPEMAGVGTSLEPAPPRHGNRLMELAGPVDGENRYLPAVIVTALSGEQE